jgi:anti-sigma factor RsiW
MNEAVAGMKKDSQHLDFLVSQYVDGCLEGTSRKSVEQQLLHDPAARSLYSEHREVQDLLDDWGNRIPLIDWADFDRNLDARLEKEQQEQARSLNFRRRMRPVAAAAALLIAVGIGYVWSTVSHGTRQDAVAVDAPTPAVQPARGVQFHDMAARGSPSSHSLVVVEPAAQGLANGTVVSRVSLPADSEAAQSLWDTLALGMPTSNLPSRGSVSFSSEEPLAPIREEFR